jgi:hypothetical protein
MQFNVVDEMFPDTNFCALQVVPHSCRGKRPSTAR